MLKVFFASGRSMALIRGRSRFLGDSIVGDRELNWLSLKGQPTLKRNAGNLTEKGNDGDHSSQFRPVTIGWPILQSLRVHIRKSCDDSEKVWSRELFLRVYSHVASFWSLPVFVKTSQNRDLRNMDWRKSIFTKKAPQIRTAGPNSFTPV
jgi:hypothetical protein